MDQFSALYDDEDVKSFQELDFDNFWDLANATLPLSDEEKTLFPDMNQVIFHIEENGNPLLSSAAMEDTPVLETYSDESDNSFIGGVFEDVNIEYPMPEGIDLDMKEEPTTLSSPTRNAELVEDVLSIHSYSQPSNCNPEKADEIVELKHQEESKSKQRTRKVSERQTKVKQEQPTNTITKRARKPVKRFAESSDDESEDEYDTKSKRARCNSSVQNLRKKVKLYEMAPFDDPEMERCRQNAINAKVNRDRKKKEKNAMQSEMSQLRHENASLREKNRRYRARMAGFEARLLALENIIRSNRLDGLLKASGNDIKADQGLDSSSSSDDEAETHNDDEVIYYD